ncbi:head GIN domain-containing protein [Patiriisocius marinus]|uniref:Lipoprotein n=1 Tax=Patiriisocius marinus TaxID=1397112 RepID=A0A5J4IZW3_9FLAO|nr:head GIN domain-containing protein [Patiriisocius marinus]GER59033.1 lipoprotein [Patiriisocius marinus]
MKAIKLLFICVLTFTAVSCQWDINLNKVNGNGNVVTEERDNIRDFDRVKGSAGLQVFLKEGKEQKVVVEADDNLMAVIETYVEDGMLRIGVDGNIGRASSKKVFVTYTTLNEVRASSGSHVIVEDEIKNEDITLDASSGAMLEASVFSKKLYLEASSGANVEVTGKTKELRSKASSGGHINAENVLSAVCNARASSGGHIQVNVKDKLEAKATSGGQIDYYGDPSVKSENKNYSGDVRKM